MTLHMSYFVYVLYSEGYDRFYIGQSDDVDVRLIQHNSGFEPSTAPYRPWTLRCTIEKESRGTAMVLERKLKNLNHIKLRKFIDKYT